MRRLSRSVLDILVGNISVKLLGLLFTPLLVRALTKPEYGQFAGVLVVFQLAQRLSNVGLFQAVNKHTAAADSDDRKRVLIGGLSLGLVYSLIGAALVYLLSVATNFESLMSVTMTYAAIAVILFRNPFEVFRGYLYGLRRERIAQFLRLIQKVSYTVLGLGAAYAGAGVAGVFGGYAVSFFVVTAAVLAFVYKRELISRERFPTRDIVERVGRYGAVSLVGYMSVLLLYKVDVLLIRYLIGDSATASYQAALFSAELIWIVPGAIQGALLQDISKKWSNDDIGQINETLNTSLTYGVTAIVLFGGGLAALADDFLAVYFGTAYLESTLALRVLLVGAAIYGINRLYIPVLQAVGELRRQQATNVGALFLNVVANLLLIPRYGVLGAVVGTTVSYASVIVGSVLILRRTPVSGPGASLLVRLGAVTLGFGVLFVVPVAVAPLSPVHSLIVFPPVGAVVFACLVHTTGLIDVQGQLLAVAEKTGVRR